MVNSPDVAALKEKAERIIEYLGGPDWNKKFLSNAPKEDREKTQENIAKVRFFLDTIIGLKDRLALGPINDPIMGVDIKVGEVMSVTAHPKNDKLMLCNVNLGKRAITVVTNDLNVKDENKVGVSLLPPQAFSDIVSEGMFLGMNGSILKDVEGELGQMPKGIPMEFYLKFKPINFVFVISSTAYFIPSFPTPLFLNPPNGILSVLNVDCLFMNTVPASISCAHFIAFA